MGEAHRYHLCHVRVRGPLVRVRFFPFFMWAARLNSTVFTLGCRFLDLLSLLTALSRQLP